jgi:hypothetical protein
MASQTVARVPPLTRHALFPGSALMKTRNIKMMKYLKVTEK